MEKGKSDIDRLECEKACVADESHEEYYLEALTGWAV